MFHSLTDILDLTEGVCSSSRAQTSTGAVVRGVTAVVVVLVVAVAVVMIIALILRHHLITHCSRVRSVLFPVEKVYLLTQTILYALFLFRLSMSDLSTAKKGDITIDKNVAYNLVGQSSTELMGEGRVEEEEVTRSMKLSVFLNLIFPHKCQVSHHLEKEVVVI